MMPHYCRVPTARGIATSPANELAGYPNHTPNGVSAYNESRMTYARPLGLGLG